MKIISFKDPYGITRRGTVVKCLKCNNDFIRNLSGSGKDKKFCNLKCRLDYSRVMLQCSKCGKEFERIKSKAKNSKSGLYFCSKKCLDTSKRLENGLLKPKHYKGGRYNYIEIAFRNRKPECVDCKLCFRPSLVVHHKDHNRKNNSLENLEIVCRTHHKLRHIKLNGESRIVDYKRGLTPREKLPEILKWADSYKTPK